MGKLNKRAYRELVKDLFKPDLRYYFTDFFISYLIAIAGTVLWFMGEGNIQWVGYIVAVFAAYRAFLFIHENVHLPPKEFGPFIKVWDFFLGNLFLMPTFMYETHMDHHIPKKYGTAKDPEYLALGGKSLLRQLWFMIEHMLITPLIILVRMIIGLPVRILSQRLSNILDNHFTALVINFHYSRFKKIDPKKVIFMETSVLIVASSLTYLVMAGLLDPLYIIKGFSIIIGALFINGIRTLAAHRYANNDLHELNETEQLVDSLNYTGNKWIGLLMAPIGLRYHALHHLFPTIPYHNLDEAHRRIMENIDASDPYNRTCFTSYIGHILKMPSDGEGLKVDKE